MGDEHEDRKVAAVIPLRGRRPSEDDRIKELARDARGTDELIEALVRRGERALSEGRFKQARADCRRAIETKRAGPAVFWLLSRVELLLGHAEAAVAAAERAVTLAPQVGELWAGLAQVRMEIGDRAEAVEAATRGVELDPEAPEPWAALAELGEDLDGPIGDATRAWYWEQALDRDPNRARWVAAWARAEVRSGERREAVRRVEEAYALDPADQRIALDRAYVLAQGLDEPERAIEAYEALAAERRSLGTNERCEVADALFALHRQKGEPEKGFTLLAEVAEESPSPRRQLDLAYAALETGHARQALFAAVEAMMAAPNDTSILRGSGDVLSQLGAWVAADQVLTRYLKLRPHDADALMQRGRVREWRKAYKRAGADYDRAVDAASDSTERLRALAARAFYRLRRGDVHGAIADHGRRVRIDKEGGWSRVQRGELLLSVFEENGDRRTLAAARRDFECAVRRGNPDASGFRAIAREAGARGDYALSTRDLTLAATEGIGLRNWWEELALLHEHHGEQARADEARTRAKSTRWAIDLADEIKRKARVE